MSYEIEKSICIPNIAKKGPKRKYPFVDMEVGDSFFLPQGTKAISVSAAIQGRALNRKFVTRTVEGGMRVWRVK